MMMRLVERSMRIQMLCRFMLAMAFASFCTPSLAIDKPGMRGVGLTSCARYAELYKRDPKTIELVFGSWAHGFMAAFNLQLSMIGQPIRSDARSTDEQSRQIRMLCDAYPLRDFWSVVYQYHLSIPEEPPSP